MKYPPFRLLSYINSHLFGFIFTITFAAKDLIRKSIMYVTRWWFLGPITISILGLSFSTNNHQISKLSLPPRYKSHLVIRTVNCKDLIFRFVTNWEKIMPQLVSGARI